MELTNIRRADFFRSNGVGVKVVGVSDQTLLLDRFIT